MKRSVLIVLVCCLWLLPASAARAQGCDPSLAYFFPSPNWVQPPGDPHIRVLSHCSGGAYTYLSVWLPRARRATVYNLVDTNSGQSTGWNIWYLSAGFATVGEYTKMFIAMEGQEIPGCPTGFVVEDGAPPLQFAVVHGIVRSDTGTPLADVPVTVVEQGGATHSMTTRSDGSYALQWEHGDSVQVWIEPPSGYDCVEPVGCAVDLVPPYDVDYGLTHRVVDFTLTGAMAVEPTTWGGVKSEYR